MIYGDETLISSRDRQATADLKLVQTFLDEHGTALANAAFLLGGGAASRAVFVLIEDVRAARRVTKRHIGRLQRLHALLVLEPVGDPERLETALFAEILPGSHAVDEICRLADSVDNLLNRLTNSKTLDDPQSDEALSEAA